MKKLILVIALLFSLSVQAIDHDKKLHVGFSAAIGAVSQYYLDDTVKSLALCIALGGIKEAYDYKSYGLFDKNDMAYNAASCGLAILGVKTWQIYSQGNAVMIGKSFEF